MPSEEVVYDPILPDAAEVDLGCVILYKNILTSAGTLSAKTTASGYSVNNIKDYRTYTKWKSNDATDQYIEADFGTITQTPIKQVVGGGFIQTMGGKTLHTLAGGDAQNFAAADCLGIYNHNLAGVTVTVKYDQNGVWTNAISFVQEDNNPILVPFTRQESGKWRVTFDTLETAVEVGIIFLGEAIYFPFRPRAPYTPMDEGIEVQSEVSEAGHLLGSVIAHHPVSINPVWQYMSRTWFNNHIVPFWNNHAKDLKPFFYAWDLNNRPDDIYYCWADPAMRFREVLTLLEYTDEFSLQLKSVNTN